MARSKLPVFKVHYLAEHGNFGIVDGAKKIKARDEIEARVKLAVTRARASGTPAVFWLDEDQFAELVVEPACK
ncbi:MAG: hypothetical protein HOE14_11990 [Gemmatimonadales bacterium]|jgi:monomeric isocitrate dehydrogenase|nr:hypothetical protein [Gemmatimonadales bacterium]